MTNPFKLEINVGLVAYDATSITVKLLNKSFPLYIRSFISYYKGEFVL